MNINVKKYNHELDYEKVIEFLRNQYKENKNMVSWLPQRFDDLVYRVDTLYKDERGKLASKDYIYIYYDNEAIVALITPDSDACYLNIKNGYEHLVTQMLDLAEKELLPLFEKDEDGKVNFLVVAHRSQKYMTDELTKRGYKEDNEFDYDNYQLPLKTNYDLKLPDGFKHTYGSELKSETKSVACHYGFKPEFDDGNLTGDKEGILAYKARSKSMFFNDSFESLIMTEDNDICSYSFCYVDKETSTAFIEPVSTRQKYRRKGLGRVMLQAIVKRLKDEKIEKCYVNSYSDWRRNFYNSAGFITEDTIGFWFKEI